MGGSAREWSAHIDGPLVAGTNVELSLVMTKFGGNAVTIGYEVILEP